MKLGRIITLVQFRQSSEFVSLSFDQGFQIVIPPRSPPSVPEPIGMPSDGILHPSDCCLLCQFGLGSLKNGRLREFGRNIG